MTKLVVFNPENKSLYKRYARHNIQLAQKFVESCLRRDPNRKLKIGTPEEAEAIGGEMVERVNLMSGEKYMERRDTLPYCSPAYESYWSI